MVTRRVWLLSEAAFGDGAVDKLLGPRLHLCRRLRQSFAERLGHVSARGLLAWQRLVKAVR